MTGLRAYAPAGTGTVAWRVRFVAAYAVAMALALGLAGAAACGLKLQWYLATGLFAFAMATFQFVVVRVARLPLRGWWPLTLVGMVAALPAAFTAVYVLSIVLLGVPASIGVEEIPPVFIALPFILSAAAAAIVVAAVQSVAFRAAPDRLFAQWIVANAVAGLIAAPAIEHVVLGCALIGIGPEWLEGPIAWIVGGALGGVFTGLALAQLRPAAAR